MNTKSDLASVIIRTKDRPKFLQRAIDSVCSQDYSNIELIVINDGGVDISDVINHYKFVFKNVPGCSVQRDFIYIRNTVSVMRAGAANIGLDLAKGKYICLLDDDDYFYSQHLSKHINAQKKNNSVWSISKSLESIEDETGKEKLKKYNFPTNLNMVKFYFFENYFPSNSIVFQRELVDKIGIFDKNLQVLEDWDLWIRMWMESNPYLLEKITSVYTTRNGSSNVRTSFNDRDLWRDSFKKVMEKYKGIYKDKKVSIPLSEIDNFLSNHAVQWYSLTKENEELRDSFAYKIYNSKIYKNLKDIKRILTIKKN